MHRRSLLLSAGVITTSSLSGCLGATSTGESPDNQIDAVVTDSDPDLPITPSVSVVTAESSTERPMRIAVQWENESQEKVRFGEERSMMFHVALSDDEQIRLLSDEYGTWDSIVSFDDCWYVSGAVSGDGAYRVVNLESEEAHQVELDLYAATDDCITTDSYRFQTSAAAWDPEDSSAHPPSEEWGFVIKIDST